MDVVGKAVAGSWELGAGSWELGEGKRRNFQR
jgi:hypothetical protein